VGLGVVVQGRLKSLYSVHRKMTRKGCGLEASGGAPGAAGRGLFGREARRRGRSGRAHEAGPRDKRQSPRTPPPAAPLLSQQAPSPKALTAPPPPPPLPPQEVYDARALRVIVDDCGGQRLGDAVQACYRLVAAVHKLWRPIAHEYDDYIANVRGFGGWVV
jgi:hypothetical protein